MSQQMESAQTKNIPAKAWVRFLRTYGPTPNGAAMFDEHVTKAAYQAKVDPIELPLPLLPKMLDRIQQQTCGSILIAGTAGDGKTYHCRSLWHELGGDASTWGNGCSIKRLKLQDGRDAYFIKDLSELNDIDNNLTFSLIERSVLENDNNSVVIVAANHGQILECLRKRRYLDHVTHPLKPYLEAVFLQAGEGHPRLQVFDLSRSTHRKSLTDVLDVLTNHPEWEKCHSCQFQKAEMGCPIFENRRRLIDQGDAAQQMRLRMTDLIELARLNGSHLPIRDLLALCANILLGHPDAKDGLMRCDDVGKMTALGTVFKASLYDNIVAANLMNRRVTERPIFKVAA
jgi:broad-specificity NMP kinase